MRRPFPAKARKIPIWRFVTAGVGKGSVLRFPTVSKRGGQVGRLPGDLEDVVAIMWHIGSNT